jgi:hypothetical protein
MNKFIKNQRTNMLVEQMRKAQAAMEYLMTYGWAVLIMLVVIGVLFYLGIFNPHTIATCSFASSGFTCYAYKITSNTSGLGGLILNLGQGIGDDIKVFGFNCTTSTTWNEVDFDGVTASNVTIPSGSHAPLNGSVTSPMPLPCYKSDGSKIGPADSGSYYTGKIYIHYLDLQTNLDHKLTGDISGKIE